MKALVLVLCALLVAVAMAGGAASAAEGDEVPLAAGEGGTVMGYVDNGNTSVPGATVDVVGNGTVPYSTVSSSPLGFYSIDGVAPGMYYATADKSGYNKTPTKVFEVTQGKVTWVNITMMEHPTWLSGKVTYSGDPLGGVLVILESEGGTKYTQTTDDEGGYVFQVPSGEYTVTFSKSGYATAEKDIVLLPVPQNTLDVAMKKSALPGNTGFLPGYDLPHSMMIVGLVLSLVTLVTALLIRFRIRARPELLAKEERK